MMTPADYLELYAKCVVTSDPRKLAEIENIVRIAKVNCATYQQVANAWEMPWQVIAAIHYRESDQNFRCHLHNGDPLTARTVHVPRGRPVTGSPPFTWVESAIDAFKGEWVPSDWGLASCLEFIERYNGVGYQKHGVNTPYLWDYTNQYASGLYVADGSFDPKAVESRPGAVPILKGLGFIGVTPTEGLH